ncbi:Endonuclease/exonuclease/phosphatase [Pilobolus umbonatus]|nr:Endonuclease/exonuclease/phosphatase [Pilobolus umbonatus]
MPTEPYHDEEVNTNQPLIDETNGRRRVQSHNSFQDSIISTQSSPPPYDLYPPAKSLLGRAYNWLRKIPRSNTHQPIYLPIIPGNDNNISSRSLFSFRRFRTTETQSTLSNASSIPSHSCWSNYYHAISDRLPDRPRLTLPSFLAPHRCLLISLSFFFLILFSFLLFCSIFFSPETLPDPVFPDKITNTTARFLTLNIFMRPPLIKNNWSDYKDDRLAYIEKYILPEYDIITFQESFAFASRRKDHLIKAARLMGFNHHVESPRKYPWQLGIDGGLLMISRFPIVQSNVIEYPRGHHSDWLSIKGVLHALIQLNPTHKINLYTTHTQASYDLNNVINPDDTAIRLSQFSIFHNFIHDTAKENEYPIMIAGDLNVDAATHPITRPITQPSTASSVEYTQMVDVISGKGVKNAYSDERWFEHPWKLDIEDVLYRQYKYHPVTFGDYTTNEKGELIPAETVLTNWDQLMTVQSIDRVFWADGSTEKSRVGLTNARVEKFWVKENELIEEEERQQIGFTQISGTSS